MPDVQERRGAWLDACLWCCLIYFAIDAALRARNAAQAGGSTHIFSLSGLVDLVGVIAVPIALAVWREPAYGVAVGLAMGAQAGAGFARPSRRSAGSSSSRPSRLLAVLALFMIILFLSSAAMYVIEREQQPGPFGTLPAALWWAVVTLTTTGYGDAVPLTHLGTFSAPS